MSAISDSGVLDLIADNGNGFCIIHVELDNGGRPIDWTFLHVNEVLAKFEGKSAEELIGHRFFELFPERSRRRLKPHYEAAYLGKNISFDDISYELGEYVHIDVYPTGELGCCACVLCNIKEDIYEELKRRGEGNALKNAYGETEHERVVEKVVGQAKVINAISTLYTTIVETDIKTHSSRVIKSAKPVNSIIGTHDEHDHDENVISMMEHFLHPDDRERMLRFMDLSTLSERMSDKQSVAEEFRSVYGKFYVGRFIVSERDEHDQISSVLFAARDITWEKEREIKYLEQLKTAVVEADNANLSKTNFLRRMSHDIRTPLNGIIGMLHIMENNRGDTAKYEEYMDKIIRSTDYLLNIVNNVLEVSKMETGEIELEHKSFDLEQLILNTLPIIATNASQSSVLFTGGAEYMRINHPHVIGSPVHINRVLMNVASNAIKYNRTGGNVKIGCNELSCDGEQATYEIVCADTGLGMSEEFQKRAFEPFAQEGKQTITSYSGSGLGLSIVRKIVEKMGGTIELQSKENVGTTIKITITLPLDREPQYAGPEEIPEMIDLTGQKALLVEDNEINMEIASILLEEMGLEIVTAKNGSEAVDIFSKSEPDTFSFIFMDMMMPVMDGLEATKTIRTLRRPDAATVPIIAMTANAFAEDRQICLEAGMNEHVGKPIDLWEITRAVQKFVK